MERKQEKAHKLVSVIRIKLHIVYFHPYSYGKLFVDMDFSNVNKEFSGKVELNVNNVLFYP